MGKGGRAGMGKGGRAGMGKGNWEKVEFAINNIGHPKRNNNWLSSRTETSDQGLLRSGSYE